LSLLRDDRLVTLHDLVEVCRAASQHCLLAAESMPGDPRAAALRDLGERRAADAVRAAPPSVTAHPACA